MRIHLSAGPLDPSSAVARAPRRVVLLLVASVAVGACASTVDEGGATGENDLSAQGRAAVAPAKPEPKCCASSSKPGEDVAAVAWCCADGTWAIDSTGDGEDATCAARGASHECHDRSPCCTAESMPEAPNGAYCCANGTWETDDPDPSGGTASGRLAPRPCSLSGGAGRQCE